MKKKNPHWGSSLDDFLKEEGIYDEAVAQVEKEVIAWQLQQAMKKKKITKKRMAELMRTSRTQVDKLLNPTDGIDDKPQVGQVVLNVGTAGQDGIRDLLIR